MYYGTGTRRAVTGAVLVLAAALALPAAATERGAADATPRADDTGRNVRDRDGKTLTPQKQSNDKSDVEVTRRVRQAIVKDGTLSTDAHNVKIITQNGIVTLRGPVDTAEERAAIAAKARRVAGVKKVDDQLEVSTR